MSYTKGEWKAGSTRGMDNLYHNFVQSVDKPDLFPLARVSGINEGEVQANAHLIAAAPNTYEGLKETTLLLENILSKFVLSGSAESIKRTIRDNKQALAKAEGRKAE